MEGLRLKVNEPCSIEMTEYIIKQRQRDAFIRRNTRHQRRSFCPGTTRRITKEKQGGHQHEQAQTHFVFAS